LALCEHSRLLAGNNEGQRENELNAHGMIELSHEQQISHKRFLLG
jgi:hypothetical protein